MAAGKFTVLDSALSKILDDTIDLGQTGLKMCLCDVSEALSATWTGTSGDGLYSDLVAEVTGTGYTAGGLTLTGVSLVSAAGSVSVSADPASWTGVTITAKFGVIYKAAGDQDILGFFDLETLDPIGRQIIDADLTVSFPSSMMTLTRTA